MTTAPSRRAILAGTATALAAGSVVNLAALAIAKADIGGGKSPPPIDPIFAAIERHRTVYDGIETRRDWEDDDLTAAVLGQTACYEALRLMAAPITLAGWAALLRYVVEYESNIGDVTPQLCEFSSRMADALDRMAVAS